MVFFFAEFKGHSSGSFITLNTFNGFTLFTAIQSFIDFIQFEKRYSVHTIRSYQDDLNQFNQFSEKEFGQTPLAEISSSIIRTWLASMKDAGLTSKSINRKISSLKSFFKYQLRTGAILQSPMTQILSPKMGSRLPVFIEQPDIQTLFSTVEFPDDWKGQTARLLLAIFYNTGIRLSGLVNLKESQVDFGNSTIKVLGKGNKERIIPVSPALSGQIKDYIRNKSKAFERPDAVFLLVNQKGKKLYPKYTYLEVKKYLGIITTLNKKSPHILRHTFATHLANSGADLNAIKELLGHSSLAATQVYTHNSIEKLKNIHKKAHPKA
jgi:integrase/recombinase XerC